MKTIQRARNPIPAPIRALVIGGWMTALLCWELRNALRRVADSKLRRDVRNFAMAAMAGAVMQSLELPVAFRLAGRAQERQSGLVQRIGVPQFLRPIVAVVLLDYTLYLWHVLTHRVPLLWRFHQVHHIDREMDASTALRFHFGEITLSVAFRAAQVLAIGATPATLAAWQMFLFVCILFHHSNVRLPIAWERRVARIVMTPRLHGIHHSIAPADVNSNWSSGLTVWDWLHGTLRTDVPQHSIVIGVAGHLNYGNQELKKVLTVPFTESSRPIPRSGGRVRQPISALED